VRGKKVKLFRKLYSAWVQAIAPRIPDKMRAISFRVWRRRVTRGV
jgi:hypothetical protein